MLTLRKSEDRGHFDHGWLDTYHTFSFADYFDPKQRGFRTLRVINDDRVAPGEGFGTHPHRDMEIITLILAGSLEHKDSMGTGSIIRPGDVQRMTAGTGVTHSEFNPSPSEPVHLLQIWILPEQNGLKPGYEQKHFSIDERRGALRLVASPDGRQGSITIHQDVNLYATVLEKGAELRYRNPPERFAWLHLATGGLRLGNLELKAGDGVAISGDETLLLKTSADARAEAILFDLN